jgi:WASH complex subunit strumpellin
VFYVANELVKTLTPKIKAMPGVIEQTELRDFALFDKRAIIAKCASEIAVYVDGVLNMSKYMIGIIVVVPTDILEDGLRKELLEMITGKLES